MGEVYAGGSDAQLSAERRARFGCSLWWGLALGPLAASAKHRLVLAQLVTHLDRDEWALFVSLVVGAGT